MEEIQRQNIVKEYKKFCKYQKEYEQGNLNVLVVNGKLIPEKAKLMDRWKEIFK